MGSLSRNPKSNERCLVKQSTRSLMNGLPAQERATTAGVGLLRAVIQVHLTWLRPLLGRQTTQGRGVNLVLAPYAKAARFDRRSAGTAGKKLLAGRAAACN
jgi:hypothetical protein